MNQILSEYKMEDKEFQDTGNVEELERVCLLPFLKSLINDWDVFRNVKKPSRKTKNGWRQVALKSPYNFC